MEVGGGFMVCVCQGLMCIYSGRDGEDTWPGFLAPLFPYCVVLDQRQNISEPQSPRL